MRFRRYKKEIGKERMKKVGQTTEEGVAKTRRIKVGRRTEEGVESVVSQKNRTYVSPVAEGWNCSRGLQARDIFRRLRKAPPLRRTTPFMPVIGGTRQQNHVHHSGSDDRGTGRWCAVTRRSNTSSDSYHKARSYGKCGEWCQARQTAAPGPCITFSGYRTLVS